MMYKFLNRTERIVFFLLTFVAMIIILIVVLVVYREEGVTQQKRAIEYEWVTSTTSINTVIAKFTNERGIAVLTTSKNKNYFVVSSWNYDIEPDSFARFAKVGDSLIKNANNDTLFVKTNKQTVFFILGNK